MTFPGYPKKASIGKNEGYFNVIILYITTCLNVYL